MPTPPSRLRSFLSLLGLLGLLCACLVARPESQAAASRPLPFLSIAAGDLVGRQALPLAITLSTPPPASPVTAVDAAAVPLPPPAPSSSPVVTPAPVRQLAERPLPTPQARPVPTPQPVHLPSAPVIHPSQPATSVPAPATATPASTPAPQPTFSSTGLSVAGIVALTNQQRQQAGLSALRENSLLDQAASARVADMVANHYFSHQSPTGLTYVVAVSNAGFGPWSNLGENIAYGSVGYLNDRLLMDNWMNSPGHRANILSTSFQQIGVGIGQGSYQGQTVWFAVQIFGTLR